MNGCKGERLAVVGSRDFDDFELFVKIMDRLRLVKVIDVIISGGAKGVDSMARHYSEVNGIDFEEYLSDWDKHGRSAGFIRNQTIWDNSTSGIAIWDGISKGTAHSFEISKKQNKPLIIFNYNLNRWVDRKGEPIEKFK